MAPQRTPAEHRSLSFTDWRATFRPYAGKHEAKALGLTLVKPGQGVAGFARFSAGTYPACSEHGAMNRVAKPQLWRCINCNIGVELLPRTGRWEHENES